MKKRNILIIVLVILLALVGVGLFYIANDSNIKISYTITPNQNNSDIVVQAKSNNFFNSNLWIYIDENPNIDQEKWQLYVDGEIYHKENGTYYIHIKDEKDNITIIKININGTAQNNVIENGNKQTDNTTDTQEVIEFNLYDNLLPAYPIGDEFTIIDNDDSRIILSSSNENVVSVSGTSVITKSKGTATITANVGDITKSIDIRVTDLYTLPDYSDDKPFLKETICDQEEAHMLDEILEIQIDEAGYQTRAGVVAAARFLSLQFPYKLAYFSESGRLDSTTGTAVSDGEGRYYHKGLYLSEDKFDLLERSIFGQATWGQFFEADDSDDHSQDDYYLYAGFVPADIGSHKYLSKRPNGFDCSGFVAWCYYNGGFDFGDMGAGGPGSYGMTNLGELAYINNDLLQSDRIKAGDLVGYPSHVGIIIGVEDDYIWIADTLITGLKVTKYERNVESFKTLGEDAFTYFMLMDDEYIEDGNYTPMWQ